MPMNKSLLITRPNHDNTTNYLYYWSVSVVDEAKKKGFDVYDLFGKKADKENKAQFVNKSIIYARSCDAGSVLGRELVKEGAMAFIGYVRKFIFAYTSSKITKPLQDSLAGLFLEPSNLVVTTIIKGHSVLVADQRSKASMLANFRKMISTSAAYEEKFAARWLWGNIKNQVVLGGSGASLNY